MPSPNPNSDAGREGGKARVLKIEEEIRV